MRASILGVIGVAALAGIGGGVAQASRGASRASVVRSLRADLSRYLVTRRRAEHLSGLGLTVSLANGAPNISVAVGRTRYRGGRPISPVALWQVGSNTKAFTAVLLLKLEAEHKLSVNDTLGKWLPQYPAWRRITIKQLLDMTAGIQDYANEPAFLRDYAAAPHRLFSESRLVSYVIGLPLKPGWTYSNTNYVLAQMIIERVAHDSYADQLRKRIFKPLGLRSMFFSATSYPRSVMARLPAGYYYIPPHILPPLASQFGKNQTPLTTSWCQAGGGIVSSPQDLATWDRALYTGRELPARQQRELENLVSEKTGRPIKNTTPADPAGFGLGVQQATFAALGGTFWSYTGSTLGFRVMHAYWPRRGTDIVVGLNSHALEDHTPQLLASLYRTLHNAGLA